MTLGYTATVAVLRCNWSREAMPEHWEFFVALSTFGPLSCLREIFSQNFRPKSTQFVFNDSETVSRDRICNKLERVQQIVYTCVVMVCRLCFILLHLNDADLNGRCTVPCQTWGHISMRHPELSTVSVYLAGYRAIKPVALNNCCNLGIMITYVLLLLRT